MYYNQYDYDHVPYPSSANPKATIQTGGCGVCCSSTILSLFGNDEYPPGTLAPIFRQKGARVSSGTDMRKAAEIICNLGNLTFTTSSSETELVLHLRAGGLAIANVDGDLGEKGIFSTQGHYICIVGIRNDGRLQIWDPADRPNKFKDAYRAQHVQRDGQLLVCSTASLDIDTKLRTPNYYLFKKVEEEMSYEKYKEYKKQHDSELAALPGSAWSVEARDWAISMGLLQGDQNGNFAWRSDISCERLVQVLFNMCQRLQR